MHMAGGASGGVERALGPSGAPLRWASAQIELASSTPPGSSGVSREMLDGALAAAAHTWNEHLGACGAPSFSLVTDRAERAGIARDGVSRVVVRTSWCKAGARDLEDCYDPSRAAITHLYPAGAPLGGVQLVAEADIELNAEHFRWSELGSDTSRPLLATLTHELGHVLGLAHPCRPPHEAGPGDVSCASSAAKGWLMYPDPAEAGRAVVSEPGPAEVDAVCAAYASGSTGSGVNAAPLGGVLGVLVLGSVGILLLGQRRRRVRSRAPT